MLSRLIPDRPNISPYTSNILSYAPVALRHLAPIAHDLSIGRSYSART
jgi:hypothetical protein